MKIYKSETGSIFLGDLQKWMTQRVFRIHEHMFHRTKVSLLRISWDTFLFEYNCCSVFRCCLLMNTNLIIRDSGMPVSFETIHIKQLLELLLAQLEVIFACAVYSCIHGKKKNDSKEFCHSEDNKWFGALARALFAFWTYSVDNDDGHSDSFRTFNCMLVHYKTKDTLKTQCSNHRSWYLKTCSHQMASYLP